MDRKDCGTRAEKRVGPVRSACGSENVPADGLG
jgi:hypothetical protein